MKYDAFISYRHSEKDMYVAKKVHKGLETYKVPRSVKKRGDKASIKRVFRDQEELPIGSDLGDNISAALEESEFLLVICSPRLPQSEWCRKEINTFIKMHDREHILAVLVEGEPNESFPEELLTDENGNNVEPLAADVRGNSKREINKKLRTEIVRLAAPLLHCSYDDLKQRHRERKLKRIFASVAVAAALVAGLGIGFGVYNAKMAAQIEENYEAKQVNQSKYLAETSLRLFNSGDRRAAALVAAEALPSEENPRPYVPEAEYALSKALYTYSDGKAIELDRQLHHDLPVRDMSYDVENKYLVSIDSENSVYVWEVSTGKLVLKKSPDSDKYGYYKSVFSANVIDDKLVIVSEGGIKQISLSNSEEEWLLEDSIVSSKFSGDFTKVGFSTLEKAVVFDLSGKKVITEIPKEGDYFSGDPAFSDDGRYMGISSFARDKENGCIFVINLDNGNVKKFTTEFNYIVTFSLGENGDIYTVSSEYDSFSFYRSIDSKYPMEVEKFSLQSEEPVWRLDISGNVTDMLEGYTKTVFRAYEGHKELVVLTNKRVCTYDAQTGEEIARMDFSDIIYGFRVAKNSSYGYMGERNGTINIVDLSIGYNYSSNRIETGIAISDLLLGNSIFAIRTMSSLDITLLTYHKGDSYFEIENMDSNVYDLIFSPEKENFVSVAFGEEGSINRFSFFDSESFSLISRYDYPEDERLVFNGYVTEDLFVFVNSKAKVTFLDIESGKTEAFEASSENYVVSLKCVLSPDSKYLVLYGNTFLGMMNTETHEYKSLIESYDYKIEDACAFDDGSILVTDSSKGLFRVETDGTISDCLNESIKCTRNSTEQHVIKVSPDGKLLAVCSEGNKVYLLNKETYSVVDEIPFIYNIKLFLEFSEDSSKLYMHGDDYILRIYDINSKSFAFEAGEQTSSFSHVWETENEICFSSLAELRMFDKKTLSEKAVVDNGKLFVEETGTIIASNKASIYGYKYTPYQMLIEKMGEIFQNEKLSDIERTRYHVD